MRLPEHHQPIRRRSSSAEVLGTPEGEKLFDGGRVIRQVVAIANEQLGGIEKLKISDESAYIVLLAHPELVELVFPNSQKAVEHYERGLSSTGYPKINEAFIEEVLLKQATLRLLDDSHVHGFETANKNRLFQSISRQWKFPAGNPSYLVSRTTALASFYPGRRQELAELSKTAQPEILKALDTDMLDPNARPASVGALLRLLDPASYLSVREIVDSHQKEWIEELDRSIEMAASGRYTGRGYQFYLNQALYTAAGLDILFAQDARLNDDGSASITPPATRITRSSQSLPSRDLTN